MVRWQTIYEYMEQKETNNEQIIKVLSFIMSRLDSLEVEQSRHKEMFYKVRKNLTDANDLINQILDVLEIDAHHEEAQNEILIEVIDLIDDKIIELES